MEAMDGAESDCSESYFSAYEQDESLQPPKLESVTVVSTEELEEPLTEQQSDEQGTRGGETTTLEEEEGFRVGCTSLISKDNGNKTSDARRRRVRHNSETTKVRDSSVINHALNGMNTLYVMWANDKLCDTIVTVDGKEFPAHSVVLATHSDYFLGLLLKQTTRVSLPRRISIDGLVSAPGFGRLLSYMYTSEIDLRWGNVCCTMQTANSLSMARVVQLGREFLQSYNIESCLNALLVSKQANLGSLHANIRNFVLDNFMAVSRTKGFLICPAEMLASLMADDNVNVDSELDILLAAKTWILHNGEDGLKGVPILIKQVRFHYIPPNDLEKYVKDDEQLMQIPEVRSKVMAVYWHRTALATTSDTIKSSSQRGSNEKPTDDDFSKLLVTSDQDSCDSLYMITSEEECSASLSDQSSVKKIPNQSQYKGTQSYRKTKALAVDKKVRSEMTSEEECSALLSDQSTVKKIPNQSQSKETQSYRKTKALAVDKKVRSEMTSEEVCSASLSDQTTVKKIPNQYQSKGTQSYRKTKALAVDKKVRSEVISNNKMTSEEECSASLSDQFSVKKIPNQSQSKGTQSYRKTKTLAEDKKVRSEMTSEEECSASLSGQSPVKKIPNQFQSKETQSYRNTKTLAVDKKVRSEMTSKEECSYSLSDQSTVKKIPNQSQSKGTQSYRKTKTLAKDKKVQSESKPPPPNRAATLHEENLVSQTLSSSDTLSSTSFVSSSPLPQSQPEPQVKSAQPLVKTSQTLSASTNMSDSVHSEKHISKEANNSTQTTGAPLLREVASPSKSSSSKQKDIIKSSQKPSLKTPQSPTPWPMPKTVLGMNMDLKPAITPVKKLRNYFAPRLTSDYRLTASNPKALASGPIAWPVTQHAEKKRRPDVIVTVGGVAKNGESEVMGRLVEAFLLDDNEWRELTRLPVARNHHVAHFLNGYVYVVGGSDPHADGDDFLKPVRSVLKYDVRSGEWSEAQPMDTARVFHEVTALFGQLYVVGGQDHAGRTLATVECYSPSTDSWRYAASLPSPRYGMAVTVYRGQLWVAGGFPEDRLAETSTVPTDVVCYNAFRDEWTLVTPLRVPRCHTSLLEMAERLYMIGGFVGDPGPSEEKNQSLSTIEMFDERKDEWVFVADLWQGRHDANTVTVGDKAYIIGGMDDDHEDPLPNVECFDPVAMSWTDGLAPLRSPRFGHACCVIPADARIKWAKS
ncbi:uncharacterized protein [Asterias amurensis]|uniref:uncharacterized protein isoform X2 n=1 Tax=Asterias amurensis TaxID=7602 RepID=UPI003AB56B93